MATILVVDDDADTCRNMADILGDLGYATDTALAGDVALEKARQQPYDVALLDLRMPGMDGTPGRAYWPGRRARRRRGSRPR
jgi:CheY-like chemotaxis protein